MFRFRSFLCFLLISTVSLSATPGRFDAGDAAFKARNQEAKARFALETFRKLYAETPQDPEAGWRLAMACYFVGLRLTQDDKQKEKLFAEGRDAGKAASKADPKCAPCHFWTAINMALYGQTVGVFKMLFSLDEVQDRLKKTAELDPRYAGAGAYRLLGTIQWKLPGVLGGNDGRARKYFETAIQTAPDEPLNYLFLYRLLKAEFGKESEKATQVAKQGAQIDPSKLDKIESAEALEELKKIVQGS